MPPINTLSATSLKQTDVISELKERREFIKPSKKRYMAKKRAAGIQRNQTKKDIRNSNKQVWVAIINGQAQ